MLEARGAKFEAPTVDGHAAAIEDPDTRIPHSVAIQLLETAEVGLGDPALGIHAAEHLRPGDFDVLEYAAMTSASVGDAIDIANQYLRLVHDAADFKLERGDEVATWRFALKGGLAIPPVVVEYVTALVLLVARRVISEALIPRAICFKHAAPADTSEHERVFKCMVRFSSDMNGMLVPNDHLELQPPKADPALRALLDRTAKQLLDKLPSADRFGDRVREIVAGELQGGNPTLEAVADKLGISSRTLRRRLQEEGTTHKQLVDGLRRDLAVQYLRERSLAVSEVSFLLGFSEPSAFHKAFKRWTGESPSEFRRGL